ncbi:MAG: hypothetical protein IPG51_14360 [Chloroflexi bacterium]|nr:hypothetical protein [Chloroflexota bacterium]
MAARAGLAPSRLKRRPFHARRPQARPSRQKVRPFPLNRNGCAPRRHSAHPNQPGNPGRHANNRWPPRRFPSPRKYSRPTPICRKRRRFPPLTNLTRPQPPQSRPTAASGAVEAQRPLWEELQAIDEENKLKQQYEDDLMPEAIEMVRQLNKSVHVLLQRRFRIGYTRAARLIDAMEDLGIIGRPPAPARRAKCCPRPLARAKVKP